MLLDLESIPRLRPAKVLLEWTFVDGLIALHQGGAFMAMVNSFPSDTATEPLWWRAEEERSSMRDMAYTAEWFRPYPPTVTSDRRCLYFSTPYAVWMLDLCSLPGWTVEGSAAVRFLNLLDSTDRLTWRIASPPVPLDESPRQAGVVLFHTEEQRHYWTVIDVPSNCDQRNSDASGEAAWQRIIPLPLEGTKCQCSAVGQQAIAFSTERGHWLWRWSDARALNTEAMLRTWQPRDGVHYVVLDQQVERRDDFTWRKQHIVLDPGEGANSGRAEGFEWFYQSSEDGHSPSYFETYHVSLGDLNFHLPARASHERAALPIGPSVNQDIGLPEMLCLGAGRGGELYRHTGGSNLTTMILHTVDKNETNALRLVDPLLWILSRDEEHPEAKRLSLYTLRHTESRLRVPNLRLAADPLIWSRWLFTCEYRGHTICICRREVPTVDGLESQED